MFFKKTIVLTGIKSNLHKAVVNIEKDHSNLIGNVRLYNFTNIPKGILTLGILHDNKVYKTILNESKNEYVFSMPEIGQLSNFTCAIVSTYQGEVTPILIGATNSQIDKNIETKLASSLTVLNDIDKNLVEKNVNNINSSTNISNECESNCNCCKYRKAFYNETKIDKNENLEKNNKTDIPNFYKELMPQLDPLFSKYGSYLELENIIPTSKWVKVPIDDFGKYYVVGVIYEEENIKYICYGIPGIYADDPPKELAGKSKWLPVNELKPFENGWWIIYQNADTGENENVEII